MTKPPLHFCRGGSGWNSSIHFDQTLKAFNDQEELPQHLSAVSFQLAVCDIPRCEAESLDQSTGKTFFRLQALPLLLIIACISKPLHFFCHIFTSYGMTKKWLLRTIAGAAVHQLNIL